MQIMIFIRAFLVLILSACAIFIFTYKEMDERHKNKTRNKTMFLMFAWFVAALLNCVL